MLKCALYFVLGTLFANSTDSFMPGSSLRGTSKHKEQSSKHVFCKSTKHLLLIVDYLCERFCVQTRAADQYAVDIGPAHQTVYVIWFNRTTVQNPEMLRGRFRYLFGKSLPDASMHILRLFRRGGDSGANGPNRLVSHDDTVQI